jgi:hypothetical protein
LNTRLITFACAVTLLVVSAACSKPSTPGAPASNATAAAPAPAAAQEAAPQPGAVKTVTGTVAETMDATPISA